MGEYLRETPSLNKIGQSGNKKGLAIFIVPYFLPKYSRHVFIL